MRTEENKSTQEKYSQNIPNEMLVRYGKLNVSKLEIELKLFILISINSTELFFKCVWNTLKSKSPQMLLFCKFNDRNEIDEL